jgi:hypothetical protein
MNPVRFVDEFITPVRALPGRHHLEYLHTAINTLSEFSSLYLLITDIEESAVKVDGKVTTIRNIDHVVLEEYKLRLKQMWITQRALKAACTVSDCARQSNESSRSSTYASSVLSKQRRRKKILGLF